MKSALLLLPILLAGCSTPRAISLFDVQHLQIGTTTDSDLRAKFGEPQQILSVAPDQSSWFYFDEISGHRAQRAGFIISKNDGKLLSSTWIPESSEALSNQQSALEYFKSSHFDIKRGGWVAHHEFSDHVTYTDATSGISLRINEGTHSVSAISFGHPSARSVAKQK